MLHLEVGQAEPEAFLRLEDTEGGCVDSASSFDGAASQRRLRVTNDGLLEKLGIRVLKSDTDGALHDTVTGLRIAVLLRLLGVFDPSIAVSGYTVGGQRIQSTGQDQIHHFVVPLRFFQLRGGYPDLGR